MLLSQRFLDTVKHTNLTPKLNDVTNLAASDASISEFTSMHVPVYRVYTFREQISRYQ